MHLMHRIHRAGEGLITPPADGGGMDAREKAEEIGTRLRAMADPRDAAGMARFGIRASNVLGVPVARLRPLAKEIGKDHRLALAMWELDIHEARMLAALVDDPKQVTEEQMEAWVRDFDTWDICDACCGQLFDRTPWAFLKAREWPSREEEFVRRAGFALMASLAVHDKKAPDRQFLELLPLVAAGASDDRNFVKKAVNWALRQIGKRNAELNKAAIACAEEIKGQGSRSARWIAGDALRELRGEAVQARLSRR